MTSPYVLPNLITPFAIREAQEGKVDYIPSFGPEYAVPASNHGIRLKRSEMNGLGYLSTIGMCLDRMGWQYEWEREVADAIGGYPKGAVVAVEYQNDGKIRQYLNMVENNTEEPPNYKELTDTTTAQNGWKPLFSTKEYSFFPNYDSRTLVREITFMPTAPSRIWIRELEPGWLLVTRTIDNWDDIITNWRTYNAAQRNAFITSNFIRIGGIDIEYAPNSTFDFLTICTQEGQIGSRLIPCNYGIELWGKCSLPISSMTVRVYRYDMEEA